MNPEDEMTTLAKVLGAAKLIGGSSALPSISTAVPSTYIPPTYPPQPNTVNPWQQPISPYQQNPMPVIPNNYNNLTNAYMSTDNDALICMSLVPIRTRTAGIVYVDTECINYIRVMEDAAVKKPYMAIYLADGESTVITTWWDGVTLENVLRTMKNDLSTEPPANPEGYDEIAPIDIITHTMRNPNAEPVDDNRPVL